MSKRLKFDASLDYYEIASVAKEATDDQILEAYNKFAEDVDIIAEEMENLKKEAQDNKNFAALDSINKRIDKINEKNDSIGSAFEVLLNHREEYDQQREAYLNSKYGVVTPQQSVDFDVTKDYYAFLDVSNSATTMEIVKAYNEQVNAVNSNDSLTDDMKQAHIDFLNEACEVLTNANKRKKYDKARAKYLKNNSASRVVDVDDSDKAKEKSDLGIAIIAGLTMTALAFLAAACIAIPAHFSKNKDNNNTNVNNNPGYEQIVGGTEDNQEDITPGTEDNNETVTPEEVEPKVDYYGDITNDALVTERVTLLAEQFNNNGIVNLNTGAPYTVEEIKKVVLYMNGAYVPETESEAYAMTNDYLNFVIALGNSEHVIYQVNYLGGEESFLPALEEMNANFKPLCLVDNVLFGDCTAYPYLKWFEDNYNAMICTTDRKECNEIFERLTQSIVEITYGKGYELDGTVYTMNDFNGLDKVNAGNLLQLYVFNYQVFRTYLAKDTYTFNNTLLGLDNETNLASYDFNKTMEFYNALCDLETLKEGITVDDNGLIVLVDPSNQGANFSSINQINTINSALSNYYAQNQTYYQDTFQKTLKSN